MTRFHFCCVLISAPSGSVDALEVNVSLAERWTSDGLLPDAIDLRSVGAGKCWVWGGVRWDRSGCDAISQADTSSAVRSAGLLSPYQRRAKRATETLKQ